MKIVAMTCLWERDEVVRIVLDNLRVIKEQVVDRVALDILTCGSEGWKSRVLAEDHGAHYLEHDNQPLGAKFNATLQAAMAFNPDAVMVLGSDNIINAQALIEWAKRLNDGVEYLGFLDGYMFDVVSGKLIQWHGYKRAMRLGEPLGSGRCYSRALLDRAEWRLWDSRKRSSLDWSVTQRMVQLKPKSMFRRMEDFGIRHLGIKTPANICSFGNLLRNSADNISHLDAKELEVWFGSDIANRILALKDAFPLVQLPETTDCSKGRPKKKLREQVVLQDMVVCPRCKTQIEWKRIIQLGVALRDGEKFVCRQCATKEQEAKRAIRSGGVLQPHQVVQRVPDDKDREDVVEKSLSRGEEVTGGVAEVEGGEVREALAFDFPEDLLAGDDLMVGDDL